MTDNVVPLKPSTAQHKLDEKTLEACVATCERVSEALDHVAKVLVGLDLRLRKLELAHNKAEREKVTKTAIYNGHGERIR